MGVWGESQAERFLTHKGYHVLTRNYHSRYGEIDLILCDDRFLVFAEVKLRRNAKFGTPAEAVTHQKQEKIRITALTYLQEHETILQPRFDVIEIYAPDGMQSDAIRIHHIENAF